MCRLTSILVFILIILLYNVKKEDKLFLHCFECRKICNVCGNEKIFSNKKYTVR